MKKVFLLLGFALGVLFYSPQNASAQNLMVNVQLQMSVYHPTGQLGEKPRSPEGSLIIGLEGHTLYMSNVDFDCELQILDENDNVVYSTFVVANTTTVVLPSTLSGDYQILLIDEDRYFSGWINL